jgi:superfamily II DNA or RNA helicase
MTQSIIITKKDDVNIKIDCDRGTAQELCDFFTFTVPGYQFMPSYRNKMWDGKIRLYNIHSQLLYAGLLDYVKHFAKERNIWVGIDFEEDKGKYTKQMVHKYLESLNIHASGQKIKPHKHQIQAMQQSLNNKRTLLLSPTASGKSLIIYGLVRKRLQEDKNKVLIVVPTKSLVEQMKSDFIDYSSNDNWDAEDMCHTIHSGRDKNTDKRVVITTWQSIYKLPEKWFEQFTSVFGDECHLFKSKSLTTLMTKLKDCPFRVGTTGTLDGTDTHKLVIEGLFGPVYKVTTTTKLIEDNLLSDLKIDCILLKHPEQDCKLAKNFKYQEEIDFIVTNPKRNEFICNLALNTKGNTLVLFQYVEKHGKGLFELIKSKANKNRKVFFIYGGTNVEQREEIRKLTENETNAIIVASYGTFSTGVSIRRLHNIIFSSPSKSRIRVLQSIGRQLRKSKYKECAKLYDIADDLHYKSHQNYTLQHFMERVKIYNSEKFNYKNVVIQI